MAEIKASVTHWHAGPGNRFHTHDQVLPDPPEDAVVLGSGFEIAGVIITGYDGGNHPLEGEVLKCRSCGNLLLPEDQGIHEDLHTHLDGMLTTISKILVCLGMDGS